MRHIKKILSYSIAGTLGLTVVASLNGCGEQAPQNFGTEAGAEQGQNVFIVVEQTGINPDTFKLVEKHPTEGPTRAILRDMDGNERFLSEEELQKIAEQEAAKVEDGSSRLLQEPSMMDGGMSFGETLMAAAAGSLIGGMIANKLAGNSNFQKTQQRHGGGRPTTSISQPYNKTANNKPKSGFFGGNKSNDKPKSGVFGGSKSSTRSSSSFNSFGG